MLLKWYDFIYETNITDVVYHRTGWIALEKILKSGKILLSSSVGSTADDYSKYPYYLSFSRTKYPKLGFSKFAPAVIEFDGRALKTKYKGKSVDYWSSLYKDATPQKRSEADEFEDRIFSKEPFLENLDKYVKNFYLIIMGGEDNKIATQNLIHRLKKIDSPLINKIRIFKDEKDFLMNRNWMSVKDYNLTEKETPVSYYTMKDDKFSFDLFQKIMVVKFIGSKSFEKDYIRKELQEYIDKFIKMGAERLKELNEDEMENLIYYIQKNSMYDEYLLGDWDWINHFESKLSNLTKHSDKTELNYLLLKVLSDEMLKYNVTSVEDLLWVKYGHKGKYKDYLLRKAGKAKFVVKEDYSKRFIFVHKSYDRYIISNRTFILKWFKLKQMDRDGIFDVAGSYEIEIKDIVNYLFNAYNEKKAKELINQILDEDYEMVDAKDKIIYHEIYEKSEHERGYNSDIGHRNAWYWFEKDEWLDFIKSETKNYEKKEDRINKLYNNEHAKIRFVYNITCKLVGEEKADEFFDKNELYINKDYSYFLNIGKGILKPVY